MRVPQVREANLGLFVSVFAYDETQYSYNGAYEDS